MLSFERCRAYPLLVAVGRHVSAGLHLKRITTGLAISG